MHYVEVNPNPEGGVARFDEMERRLAPCGTLMAFFGRANRWLPAFGSGPAGELA